MNISIFNTAIKLVLGLLIAVTLILLAHWSANEELIFIHNSAKDPNIHVCLDGEFTNTRYIKVKEDVKVRSTTWFVNQSSEQEFLSISNEFVFEKMEGEMLFHRTIPKDTPIGLYAYHGYIEYELNPIKDVKYITNPSYVFVACADGDIYFEALDIVEDDTLIFKEKKKKLNALAKRYHDELSE